MRKSLLRDHEGVRTAPASEGGGGAPDEVPPEAPGALPDSDQPLQSGVSPVPEPATESQGKEHVTAPGKCAVKISSLTKSIL